MLRKELFASFLALVLLAQLVSTVFAWEMERPSATYTVARREDKNKCNGEASVGLGIDIDTYNVGSGVYPPYDWLRLIIAATANTREIIEYGVQDADYGWYELGDDCQIPYPGASYDDDYLIALNYFTGPSYNIRFYGGTKSGEYENIEDAFFDIAYVSTNGFLCFYRTTEDNSYVESWKSYPYNIPDSRGPNAFIAPFWKDLKPNLDGKIKAGLVHWGTYLNSLCITWEDIPDANSQPQTFQLIIGSPKNFWQSPILFQYKEVTPDDTVKIGIECQTGKKGVSYDPLEIGNEEALVFPEPSLYAFIKYLTIKIIRVTTPAEINIIEDPDLDMIRGHNIKFESEEPDPDATFALALAGDIALLLMGLGPPPVAGMGFLLGGALITYKVADYLGSKIFLRTRKSWSSKTSLM